MQNKTTDTQKYENLMITGDISIEPVPANEKVSKYSKRIVIVGPTGAGKSSFIEALAGSTQKLEISKDQLAGYTQRVQAYHLKNVFWAGIITYPIYLIDTPGFSDTKISETEVIDMLRTWLNENDFTWFDRILFLMSITQPRLAGSKRRTIAMLSALLKPTNELNSMTFVTSMWDQVYSEQAEQRAKAHFAQLRDVILKECITAGGSITEFRNTRNSAVEVLNTASLSYETISSFSGRHNELRSHLYYDLHERIEGALHVKKSLESDLATPHTQDNLALQSFLQQNHAENEETLRKFVGQLGTFEMIPDECTRAAQDLRKRIAAEATPVDSDQAEVFRLWALESEIQEESLCIQGEPPAPLSESRVDSPVIPPHPAQLPALKGLIRRLINVAKRRGTKWFKQRA